MTIHEEVNDLIKLAQAYAEDGAFASAARVLREVAAMYQKRAEEIHSELAALTDEVV